MNSNPVISILLPVYNGEKTIVSTLKSLLNQSYTNFEILIGVDGSTDNSELEIKKIVDTRIRLFVSKANRGLGPNLNFLLYKASKGSKYIAMAEQDDIYVSDRLLWQMEFLDANSTCGMVSGIAEHFDGDKFTMSFPGLLLNGFQYPIGQEMFLLNYREQIKVVNTCMMFRKSVHEENGLYFSRHFYTLSCDWSYILRFSLVSEIKGLHKVLVRMERSKSRASLTTQRKKQSIVARELIRSFAFEYPQIITSSHLRYAINTQRLVELSSFKWPKRLLFLCIFILLSPFEIRYYIYFKDKIWKRFF
jgi:glycosyltransferase involved in cell wall biosynthesis